MTAQIKPGNYRLLATNNECLTMGSDKEGKRLNITPVDSQEGQIFWIESSRVDDSITIKNVKHGLYVSYDTNPTIYSGVRSSRSAEKFKMEPGFKSSQRRLYVQSPFIKLYLWYALENATMIPPQAGLIPDNPDITFKNWRLEAVKGK